MRLSVVLLLLLGVIGPLSAQTSTPQPSPTVEPPVQIVTTTTQVTDLVQILAAGLDRFEIVISPLMGPGVDPHLYQPTESDIQLMNNADAVIYSGLHLEGQFDEVFEALGERGVAVYAITTAVDEGGYTIPALDDENLEAPDPHFWFDPRNWQLTTQATAEFWPLLILKMPRCI